MWIRPVRVAGLFCLLGSICLALGCSKAGGPMPNVGKVTGKVTLDGQPLADARVMFQPETGRASFGTTNSSGDYTLTYIDNVSGAVVGRHQVIIRTEIPGEDGEPPVAKEKLPKKYHDESALSVEVTAGSNQHDFALQAN